MSFQLLVFLHLIFVCLISGLSLASEPVEDLHRYVEARIAEFDQISNQRRKQLVAISEFAQKQVNADQDILFTFICTHNSRRSHMAQLWSAVAAKHYQVADFESYSGGTEATAFNPRAVAALQRTGMKINILRVSDNPEYTVSLNKEDEPEICFSKVYNSPPNPEKDFAAVMVCSDADASCPVVQGAIARFAIPYEDPKVADNTPAEAAKYDERSAQIAREMLYLFSLVSSDERSTTVGNVSQQIQARSASK